MYTYITMIVSTVASPTTAIDSTGPESSKMRSSSLFSFSVTCASTRFWGYGSTLGQMPDFIQAPLWNCKWFLRRTPTVSSS